MRRFAHVYIQSGGPNRERLYRAGFSPPRADRAAGAVDQVRAELNGNPVQSHGYRAGFSPPRVDRAAGGP